MTTAVMMMMLIDDDGSITSTDNDESESSIIMEIDDQPQMHQLEAPKGNTPGVLHRAVLVEDISVVDDDADDSSTSSSSSSSASCSSTSTTITTELVQFQSSSPIISCSSTCTPPSGSSSSLNLRHGTVGDRIVQYMASLAQQSVNSSTQQHHPPLEELWLGPCFASPQTVLSSVHFLPQSLRHLDLDLRNSLSLLPQVIPIVFSHTQLQSLGLRLFGDSGAMELAKWLHCNPHLQTLDLRGNRIGSVGARAIVDALLDSNHGLSTLSLSCNCILEGDMMAKLISHPQSQLKVLDLSYNWLDDNAVQEVCQALSGGRNSSSSTTNKTHSTLQELNLFGCQRLTNVACEALVHCLEYHNTTLQQIKIHSYIDSSSGDTLRLKERMNDLLYLNRHGRYLLQCDVIAGLWPDILARCNTEPTAMFRFLREVPRLLL